MPDQSGAAARDASRDLPDRLSLRHSKLEAKRRLAAGEFTTLHDAQRALHRPPADPDAARDGGRGPERRRG